MVELSRLEIVLTRPFRVLISKQLKIQNQWVLKRYAFGVALLSCVCSGTVILFSLWTPYFTSELGYSQLQINIIGGLSLIGMYLLLPIIGNLADVYGTVLLSILSIVAFTPSYYFAALIYDHQQGYWAMAFCFALIGFGTSCLYFASLLTCANIYPDIKGLSISLPVTCYGLSSLVSSKLIQHVEWFHLKVSIDGEKEVLILNVSKIFKFFSIIYFIIGLLSYTSSCILTIQKQLEYISKQVSSTEITAEELNRDDQENHQDAAEGDTNPLLSNSVTSYASVDVLRNDDLITEVDSINEVSHNVKYRNFLRDYSAYLFLAAFFLCIGPLEMYINNMGSLVVLINNLNSKKVQTKNIAILILDLVQPQQIAKPISISTQVSYHAFFSTGARLVLGAASDYLASKSSNKIIFKNGFCRVWLLIFVLVVGVIDQCLIIYVLQKLKGTSISSTPLFDETIPALYGLVSSLAGLSYGGVFTIFPSIIASIWGLDILGSTWGAFMIAPAFSSILFGIIYANIYDYFLNYKVYVLFFITGVSISASAILTLLTWKFKWSKRGFEVF